MKYYSMFAYIKRGIKNRLIIFNRKYGYFIHDKIVTFFFGNIDKIIHFNIDQETCKKLNQSVNGLKKIKFSNYENHKDFKNYKILEKKTWIYNKKDKFVYDQFDKTQDWFDIEDNEHIKYFVKSLFPKIKDYLKSHFSIVNIRVWNNIPNSPVVIGRENKTRGTYRNHKDGFPPGHIKLMVYLNPLDDDHGYFIYDENIVKTKNSGLVIAFKNSDIWHRAVPGKKKNRRVIELTILRTLKKVDEFKFFYPSSPDTMYLIGPLHAYL